MTLTLNTLPDLQLRNQINDTEHLNSTSLQIVYYDNQAFILTDNPIFEILEAVCMVWFTLEYLLRCLSTPNKKKFFKSVFNFIDLLSILPFYISLILAITHHFEFGDFKNARSVMQIFRVLRIVRIFKLARYSIGLKSLGYTLKQSYKELGMLVMFLAIGILLFSSLAYFAEKDQPNTKYTSMPATFWLVLLIMFLIEFIILFSKVGCNYNDYCWIW